jgi:hypothetical protein
VFVARTIEEKRKQKDYFFWFKKGEQKSDRYGSKPENRKNKVTRKKPWR